MTFDIESISPKAGPKFSPNLYAWLRKNKDKLEVFRGPERMLYLGYMYDGSLIGSRLGAILGTGARTKVFSYGPFPKEKFRPVPNFWTKYKKLGRCHIDPEHTTYFLDERWKEQGKKRTCLWCGLVQKKVTRKTTVVAHSWVLA